jgi:ABC-2 type transport system ATP-binding protein
MTNANNIVSLQHVSKTFTVFDHHGKNLGQRISQALGWGKARKIKFLDNVQIEINRGDFVGIIGKNGSGKTTLMHMISGAIKPNKGGVVNRVGSFIRLSLGMGFNPELSARQNVLLNASILGVPLKEIRKQFDEIIAFAELGSFSDTQLKFFSTGMRARLAFAVAVLVETDLLLMDEFFGGVGDEAFKKKAHKVFNESLLKDKTVVLISHNMETIKKYCNRVFVINDGKVSCFEDPSEAIHFYRNNVLGMNSENQSNSESLDP